MEDDKITALYFDRSEQAIQESDKKYGSYCNVVAYQNFMLPGGCRRMYLGHVASGIESYFIDFHQLLT